MLSDAKILNLVPHLHTCCEEKMDFDALVTFTNQEMGNILHCMFFKVNESYNARSTAHSTHF